MTNETKIRPPWWRKKKRRFSNPDAALDADRLRLSSYKRELVNLYASLASASGSGSRHAAVRQQAAAIRRRIGAIKEKIATLKRSIDARGRIVQPTRAPYVGESLSPEVAAVVYETSPEEAIPIRWSGNELTQE